MQESTLSSDQPDGDFWRLGACRVCRQGAVGVRACGRCGGLTLLCDECDAAWQGVDLMASPRFAKQGDPECRSCGASLWQTPAHWASRQEIAATGWLASAIASGKATLERGASFGGR